MALQISKRQLADAQSRYESLKARLSNVRKEAEKATEKFVGTLEVTGAAFTMGMIQGRTGGIEIIGMPLELIAGGLLNVGSYLGVAGKHSDHLGNLGDGCLAAYAVTVGKGVGETWKERAENPQIEASGTRRIARGSSLSPAEMANAAAEAVAQGA
jgi:hypothetical protein